MNESPHVPHDPPPRPQFGLTALLAVVSFCAALFAVCAALGLTLVDVVVGFAVGAVGGLVGMGFAADLRRSPHFGGEGWGPAKNPR